MTKKTKNKNRILMKWPLLFFLGMVIALGVLTYNILKLNILPLKIFSLFLGLEIIICILSFFLLIRSKKAFIIIGILLSIVSIFLNSTMNYYVHTTNHFMEKSFNSYVDIYTSYYVITNSQNSISSMDEVDSSHLVYYHKYSRSIDLALKELGNYNYAETNSIGNTLTIMKDSMDTYLLISKANYDYLLDSTILFQEDQYKIIKEFTVHYREEKNQDVKDSYTIYLNGVDFTGVMRDFNMLITINTKSKKILLTPLLRGYYLDVPAYGIKDTLMCLGSLDSNVSKEALEQLFDISIDYTVNVNTNSLVQVVDTLGGVEFCSDYPFTTTHTLTTDSYNDKGRKLEVTQGCREYNGVEILTIARERLHLKNNERGRIDNCKKILLSIGKKTLSTTSLMNYKEVLDSYHNLYTTDMNKDVITNLAKSFIENYSNYEILEQHVDGKDGTAIGHLGTVDVGVTFPDLEQVKTASNKIKEVLGN